MKEKRNKDENAENSNKKKKDILHKEDKVSRILALPEGTFRDFPTIEIRGNREIMIDGCTGLLSYHNENILLETRYCRIKIVGRNLTLSNLTEKLLAIRGFIQNVEFTM